VTDSEKLDLLLSEMTGMKSEMQSMKSEMQSMKSEMQSMKEKVTDIELHLENVTDWNIKLLAENHSNLVDKFNESVKTADKTALYEIHVRMLTDKVDKLSKEVSSLKLRMA